jgi:hypothetical protein
MQDWSIRVYMLVESVVLVSVESKSPSPDGTACGQLQHYPCYVEEGLSYIGQVRSRSAGFKIKKLARSQNGPEILDKPLANSETNTEFFIITK